MKNLNELKEALRQGVIEFEYLKKDGVTHRKAKGTLNTELIQEHNATPKGTGNDTPHLLKYYDLNVEGWRSCRVDNLLFDK